MTQPTTYELDSGVATIRLDDGKVNALSIAMLEALHADLDRAEKDGAVVVLTGREGYFSAGFDLNVFQNEPERIVEMLTLGATLCERVLAFPRPVLTAVSGHAIAAGSFLPLCADLRIGLDGPFKLGLNEVKIGLTVPLFVVELARHRLRPADFDRGAQHRGDVRARGRGRGRLPRPGGRRGGVPAGDRDGGRGARRTQCRGARGDQAAGPR